MRVCYERHRIHTKERHTTIMSNEVSWQTLFWTVSLLGLDTFALAPGQSIGTPKLSVRVSRTSPLVCLVKGFSIVAILVALMLTGHSPLFAIRYVAKRRVFPETSPGNLSLEDRWWFRLVVGVFE